VPAPSENKSGSKNDLGPGIHSPISMLGWLVDALLAHRHLGSPLSWDHDVSCFTPGKNFTAPFCGAQTAAISEETNPASAYAAAQGCSVLGFERGPLHERS